MEITYPRVSAANVLVEESEIPTNERQSTTGTPGQIAILLLVQRAIFNTFQLRALVVI